MWTASCSSQREAKPVMFAKETHRGAQEVVNAWFFLPNVIDDINQSPHGQDGCHLTDDNLDEFSWMKKFCILIKISMKFVPYGLIDNSPALVQIMAWRRIGDKPLTEPLLTQFTDAYMRSS